MNQILRGMPMTIFGDGTQTRAFSYVGDVAPVLADAIDTPAARNQVFNVGADAPCSLNDLARAVAIAMGVEPQIVYLEPRVEAQHAHSSHQKVRGVFGPGTHTPLEQGLAEMAAWVRRHGARQSLPFMGIEILKNFPASWQV